MSMIRSIERGMFQITAHFASEAIEARQPWITLQVLREKRSQSRILYSARVSFKNEDKIIT